VTSAPIPPPPARRPAPQPAIDARRREATAKVAAVQKCLTVLGRTGAPITRSGIAQLAGVSRSFTYENASVNAMIDAAQFRTRAQAAGHRQTMTAQQEASWHDRALNAEERLRVQARELITQRQLVADLLGQLREPGGTWLEDDRNRLREDNERLLTERNQLQRDHDDLQRKLAAARANVARLTEHRVHELFPHGPGPDATAPDTA
jgi:hypothetical protein